MTTPASHLEHHLRREVDRRWASAGVRHFLRLFAWSSPFVVIGFCSHSIETSWITGARGGLVLVLLAALVAWFGERRRLISEGVTSAAIDLGARSSEPDLLVAGAWLISEGQERRLAPLVLSSADQVAAGLAPPKRFAVVLADVIWLLIMIGISVVLALILSTDGSNGLARFARSVAAAITAKDDAVLVPESRQTQSASADSRTNVGVPSVQITMRSDRRIYILECPIELNITLESRDRISADVPLDVRLAISDGLPYPDAGFGDGFRVVSLPLGWSVSAEPGKREQRVPILDLMKRLGIYRPGLFTLQIAAAPSIPNTVIDDGLMGNQIVFQVTENIEQESIKIRQPLGTSEKPEKREVADKPHKKGNTDGPKTAPKLGDPDRLPEAQRVAKAIEPLLSGGPTIEKEVSVWNREKGGDAPLPPPPPPAPSPVPPRDLTRQSESGMPKPQVAPADREAARRYFRRVDG